MRFFIAQSMRLLPRDEKFYVLFFKQVEIISETARLLLDGLRSGTRPHGRLRHRHQHYGAPRR